MKNNQTKYYCCDICGMKLANVKDENHYFCQACYEERYEEIKEAKNHLCNECSNPAFIKFGGLWLCYDCWSWYLENKYNY